MWDEQNFKDKESLCKVKVHDQQGIKKQNKTKNQKTERFRRRELYQCKPINARFIDTANKEKIEEKSIFHVTNMCIHYVNLDVVIIGCQVKLEECI